MRLKTTFLLICMVVMMMPLGIGQAQAPQSDSLIIYANNQFVVTSENTLTAPTSPLSGCGGDTYSDGTTDFVVSPNGRYLAFLAFPAGFVDIFAQGWGGPTPNEIHVCDLQNQIDSIVYTQPEGFSLSTDTVSYELIGGLSWAPDSSALAFATLPVTSDTPRLHVLDMATGADSFRQC